MNNMKITNFSDIKIFLFNNRTVKQTIFKNTFWLAVAEGLGRLMTFVLFVYMARILGATEYGKFAYALAIISIVNILPGFASPEIITREFAKDKEKEKEYPIILSFRALLCLASIILILITSFFVTPDPILRKVIWVLSLYYLFFNLLEIIYAFLRARQWMEYEAFAKILDGFLTAALGLFVIFYFPSIQNLSYAYLVEGLVLLAVVLLFFHFKVHRISFGWDKVILKRILSFSWPLALVGIFVVLYNQIDSVMLGYFGQIAQTGWYNASLKIIKLTVVPMALISQSFYPAQSKISKELKKEFQKIWNAHMEIMIFLALPIVVGGMVLAPKIIDLFYGQNYAPSILAFQILIIMVGIIFFYDAFRQVLIVVNQQKKLFWAVLGGATINIILNLILIPRFSLYGAAIATVITHTLIFILLIKFTLKYTPINPFNFRILIGFIIALLSGGIMYLIISLPFLYQTHVFILIILGAAAYFASLYILRFIVKNKFIF